MRQPVPHKRLGHPRVTVLEQDAYVALGDLPAGSVNLVLTDPPYGITQATWDITLHFDRFWPLVWRALCPGGSAIMTGVMPFAAQLLLSAKMEFRHMWVWDRVNRLSNFLNAKVAPIRQTELVLVFRRNGKGTYHPPIALSNSYSATSAKTSRSSLVGSHNRISDTQGSRGAARDLLRIPGNVPGARRNGSRHPTEKPVSLMAYLIETYSEPWDTVLDPFCGSGSTLLAARSLCRHSIGMENDSHWVAVARHRLETEFYDSADILTPQDYRYKGRLTSGPQG